MQSFSAEVKIIGVNPYVFLPKEVLHVLFDQAKKDKGAIPVKGKINGKVFTQTLVKYAGEWRLYINGIMRNATGVDVGDVVKIEIVYDPTPRIEPMHPLFKKALDQNPKAKKTFECFVPSRQKEINRYLNALKAESTLVHNIDRIVRHLAGDDVGYFVLLRNKNNK